MKLNITFTIVVALISLIVMITGHNVSALSNNQGFDGPYFSGENLDHFNNPSIYNNNKDMSLHLVTNHEIDYISCNPSIQSCGYNVDGSSYPLRAV
jgi:hypothetical protein